jgi:multiple sugar transport system permease protein
MKGLHRDHLVRNIVIVLVLIWTLLPLYWLISTSLKTPLETIQSPPAWLPSFDISAYGAALQNEKLRDGLINSFIVALGSTFISVACGATAAYGATILARKRLKNFEFWVLTSRMAPPVAVAIPFFLMFRFFGLADTLFGLILAHVVLVVGIATWILMETFRGLSGELTEAALVDGCGYGRTFWSILLPLAAPGLVAAASVCFLFSWNDFFFALVLNGSSATTAPLAIYQAIGYQRIDLGQLAATSTIALIPTVLVIGLFQRQLVSGLTMGAVKG